MGTTDKSSFENFEKKLKKELEKIQEIDQQAKNHATIQIVFDEIVERIDKIIKSQKIKLGILKFFCCWGSRVQSTEDNIENLGNFKKIFSDAESPAFNLQKSLETFVKQNYFPENKIGENIAGLYHTHSTTNKRNFLGTLFNKFKQWVKKIFKNNPTNSWSINNNANTPAVSSYQVNCYESNENIANIKRIFGNGKNVNRLVKLFDCVRKCCTALGISSAKENSKKFQPSAPTNAKCLYKQHVVSNSDKASAKKERCNYKVQQQPEKRKGHAIETKRKPQQNSTRGKHLACVAVKKLREEEPSEKIQNNPRPCFFNYQKWSLGSLGEKATSEGKIYAYNGLQLPECITNVKNNCPCPKFYVRAGNRLVLKKEYRVTTDMNDMNSNLEIKYFQPR